MVGHFWLRIKKIHKFYNGQVPQNTSGIPGTMLEEDPQKFVDDTQKAFRLMHEIEIKIDELVSYKLKDAVSPWYWMSEESRGNDDPP